MSKKALIALLSSLAVLAGAVVLAVSMTSGPAPVPTVTATPVPEPAATALRGGISVAIAVEVQAEGTVPEGSAGYTLRLAAVDHAPMPQEGETYDLHMAGPGKATFPAITYGALGVYHYHLTLLPGTDAGATYDDIRYDVTVSVLRDETTDEWYTMISIRNAETQQKTDVPVFLVVYAEPEVTPTATPAPTGKPETISVTVRKVWVDDDNARNLRPASLLVTLSNGMTVTLSEANGWSATISGLPAEQGGKKITYTWQEAEVLGYTQTGYAVNGAVTTITNTVWKLPPETEIVEQDPPLGIGVEINHVGDTFD